jgi:predicted metalloprotease
VQYLRGLGSGAGRDVTVRRELQAECLAGVWGAAAGRAPLPPGSFVSDAAHGTAEQQRRWFAAGRARGRPADCDAVWRADAP